MEINFISVGKIKEKYFVDAIDKNIKELNKRHIVRNIQVNDEKCPEKLSDAEMEIVKLREGERIINKIPSNSIVFVLAIDGIQMSSGEFNKKVKTFISRGSKSFTFIIGGSLGLSKEVIKTADVKLSFSKLTFPHQLMKVVLTDELKRMEFLNEF